MVGNVVLLAACLYRMDIVSLSPVGAPSERRSRTSIIKNFVRISHNISKAITVLPQKTAKEDDLPTKSAVRSCLEASLPMKSVFFEG